MKTGNTCAKDPKTGIYIKIYILIFIYLFFGVSGYKLISQYYIQQSIN